MATMEASALSETEERATVLDSADALVDDLATRIAAAGTADAVGIAVPSMVDWASGSARYSVNIPLEGVPLRRLLEERLGLPVFVDNDATCAALAEAIDDEGRLLAGALVMFTVGTGVGGGIVMGGRVVRGATGAAAELGHLIVAADLRAGAPAAHRPPRPDSLEALAAGGALQALARSRGYADGRAAVDAARAGEPQAVEVLRILGERLGVGIANAINVLDPNVVAIGGGVSATGSCCSAPPARRPCASRSRAPARGPISAWPATGPRPACAGPRCWPARNSWRLRTLKADLRIGPPWPVLSPVFRSVGSHGCPAGLATYLPSYWQTWLSRRSPIWYQPSLPSLKAHYVNEQPRHHQPHRRPPGARHRANRPRSNCRGARPRRRARAVGLQPSAIRWGWPYSVEAPTPSA